MKLIDWVLPLACGLGLACTQDYDTFSFGGAGPTGVAQSSGQQSGVTTGVTATGTATASTNTVQTTATTVTNTTVTNTTTTTSATTGSAAGPGEVTCGNDVCDVTGDDACCVKDAGDLGCDADGFCGGSEFPVRCDGQSDCPGEICCVLRTGINVLSVECRASCPAPLEAVCNPGDNCVNGNCEPLADIPTVHACQ